MSRICLYYREPPDSDRWIAGDRFIRPTIRRWLRGAPRQGGVHKVFRNLCLGLDRLGFAYEMNPPFQSVRPDDRVGVLGRGRFALEGYSQPNPLVAGIGLMTHPAEWPTLFEDYPVACYLQHSEWTRAIYEPYFGARCRVWAAGIDCEAWAPGPDSRKDIDVLVYDKIQWDRPERTRTLLSPIMEKLESRRLRSSTIRYGEYTEDTYRSLLARARSMIFLSESESQGFASLECLASGVPVLAWDQGWWLDPKRHDWGASQVPATSVPYFDARCGMRFADSREFAQRFDTFHEGVRSGRFAPRSLVVEQLTLEDSARRFVGYLDDAAGARQ